MSFTREIIKKLKKTVKQKKTLSWKNKNSLSREFPNNEMINLDKITEIEVGNNECAACYSSSKFTNLLRTGLYERPDSVDKVIFLDTSVNRVKFGIRAPNYPITLDKMSFGFSGIISFKIMDESVAVGNFVSKILKQNEDYTSKELMRWLRDGPLFTAFRDLIKDLTYSEFIKTRKDDLIIELETRIGYELMDYGLELVSLDIINYTNPVQY